MVENPPPVDKPPLVILVEAPGGDAEDCSRGPEEVDTGASSADRSAANLGTQGPEALVPEGGSGEADPSKRPADEPATGSGARNLASSAPEGGSEAEEVLGTIYGRRLLRTEMDGVGPLTVVLSEARSSLRRLELAVGHEWSELEAERRRLAGWEKELEKRIAHVAKEAADRQAGLECDGGPPKKGAGVYRHLGCAVSEALGRSYGDTQHPPD